MSSDEHVRDDCAFEDTVGSFRQHLRPVSASRRPNTTTLLLVAAAYVASFLGPFIVLDIPRERILMEDSPWKYDHSPLGHQLQMPLQHQIYKDTPNDDNTLITLIALGLPPKMHLTERCVRSIRARGNFTGHIMIFTDDRGTQKYQRTMIDAQNDTKILLVQGKPDDRHPKYPNGTRVQYTKHTMKYKRYKTLSNKYLANDFPTLSPKIQYILYLDIDNLVTNPLDFFFRDYQNKVNQEYASAGVQDKSSHSLISFWMDENSHRGGNPVLQGGQFMLERRHGQACLDAWRKEMDSVPSDLDQPLLMRVVEQYDLYHCIVSLLPDEPQRKHFSLLREEVLIMSQPEQLPTIVHISGYRAKLFPDHVQRNFLQRSLDVPVNPSNASLSFDLSWEEVIQPIGVKGQRPKE